MSTEANKSLVRRALEEFSMRATWPWPQNSLRLDSANHNPNMPHVRDLDGLKQAWLDLRTACPDNHTTIDDLIAEGEQVATRSTFVSTHQNEWNGIPATGKRITINGITI